MAHSLFSALVLSLFLVCCVGEMLIRVDPVNGNDSSCLSALDLSSSSSGWSQDTPCATINAALYGNLSFSELRLSDCTTFPFGLDGVRVLLSDGIHHLSERLAIINATNVTIAAENPGNARVRCVTFPNAVPGNFDNIFSCRSRELRFEGVVFEYCGPVSSNVFVYQSSGVSFENCVFR